MAHAHGHPDSPRPLAEFTERLRRESCRVTGPRQAIIEVLRTHRHPLSNREILAALPGKDCDLATIYRSMELLERLRMVRRYDLGDGVARYELLAEGDDGHHHHLVCRVCGQVVELDECFVEQAEAEIGRRSGFKELTHQLEFFGVCPRCQ